MNAIFGKVAGEVTDADLAERAMVPLATKAPSIKQIRDVHHKIAELMASGLKECEVATAVGYSVSRISILKNDPAFEELLEYYRGTHTQARFADVDRLRMLSRSAVAELQERLVENPELMSEKDLIAIAAFGADRSGLGPTTKSVSISAALSQADIAALKSKDSFDGVTIISPEDREARARLANTGGAVDSEGEETASTGDCEEGAAVREEGAASPDEAEPVGGASRNVIPLPVDRVP